jgi:hypothetical protein
VKSAERAGLVSVDRRNRNPRDLEAERERGLELTGLRLVAVALERELERAGAKEPHAGLGVPHRASGRQLEQPSAREVREAALPRHRAEVAEAVSDHELRRRPRGDEIRDSGGRVLAVRVDGEHGLGSRMPGQRRLDSQSQRRALPAPLGLADELGADPRRERVESARDVFSRAVVDEREAADVAQHLLDEGALGHLAVRGHDRPDVTTAKHGQLLLS